MARVARALVEPGQILHHFSQTETANLTTQWLSVFGTKRQGVNSKAYLWHIFSAARYPCVAGPAAVQEYQQQLAQEYVVLANDGKTAFSTNLLPSKADFADYYVFPKNLAWTMAFTHEDGQLGPYFAKHMNFVGLNNDNLARLKKLRHA